MYRLLPIDDDDQDDQDQDEDEDGVILATGS